LAAVTRFPIVSVVDDDFPYCPYVGVAGGVVGAWLSGAVVGALLADAFVVGVWPGRRDSGRWGVFGPTCPGRGVAVEAGGACFATGRTGGCCGGRTGLAGGFGWADPDPDPERDCRLA
jgi:hypothetical protein